MSLSAALRRAACAAMVAGMAGTALGQTYSITDLDTLGGPVTAGFGVNNLGHAAAASTLSEGDYHGMFWDGSLPTDILPLAGDTQCWAFAVDGADRVVAMSYAFGSMQTNGFLWEQGTVTGLGGLAPRGISNTGIVAGFISVPDVDLLTVDHAATWYQGAVTDLGTLGGKTSYAAGVNGFGQAVGWSFVAGDMVVKAALWQGGVAHDLGTLGGARSQAYSISNSRGIAGWSETAAGQPHAMLVVVDAAGNVLSRTDLGVLAGGFSFAYGLNKSGQVVGTSGSRACLWAGGAVTDLNTLLPAGSNWVLERAWAISDTGMIVGTGRHEGQPHGFVLAPSCYANCDASSLPPILNINDFTCFMNRYAAGDAYANCDASTNAPLLNVNDFVCFMNRYAAGCS